MKKELNIFMLFIWAALLAGCGEPANTKGAGDITVAVYYFPNYHTGDPYNEKYKGAGWNEWELVKEAQPRFEGHRQPLVPAWGYTDEKDPKAMAQKIDAVTDHGIDAFIFDWYYYEGKPFLNRALDEGFLGAQNTGRLKFALMWANHDWQDIHPYTVGTTPEILFRGDVTPAIYDKICDHVIVDYFTKPNYWLIDGKAYFSIYDIQKFVESFGSLEATKEAMDKMRSKAVAAGLKGVHWNLVTWGNPVLPVEIPPDNYNELIEILGFDSATSYVWVHHAWVKDQETDYDHIRGEYMAYWDRAKREYSVPYYPNVTMGWDSSPRTDQSADWAHNWGYPYSGTLAGNTPANFKAALKMVRDKLLADPGGPRIMNINCWNEWTEGSYLEPDTVYGTAYLEAVREVFGAK